MDASAPSSDPRVLSTTTFHDDAHREIQRGMEIVAGAQLFDRDRVDFPVLRSGGVDAE